MASHTPTAALACVFCGHHRQALEQWEIGTLQGSMECSQQVQPASASATFFGAVHVIQLLRTLGVAGTGDAYPRLV